MRGVDSRRPVHIKYFGLASKRGGSKEWMVLWSKRKMQLDVVLRKRESRFGGSLWSRVNV